MEEKTVQVKKQMPKQTFAFVTFLIAVTLVLLGLAVYTQQPNLIPQPTQKPQAPVAHTVLTLSTPTLTTAGNYESHITISTSSDKVTAAQIELSYDPKALTNVDIKPGSFIQNPVVLFKKVDQANGRISLALGIPLGQKGVSGTDILATITFNEVQGASGNSSISFLPKTAVTAQGIAQSVLKSSVNNSFILNQAAVSPSPASETGTTSAQ